MLRGRPAKRDSSICAFCRHRLSQRRPGPPQQRLFSAATQCAGDHDQSRTRARAPVYPVGSGSGSGPLRKSTFSQPRRLSTTTSPKLQHSRGLYRPTDPSQLSTSTTAAASPASRATGRLGFVFRKSSASDVLDPYEAKARERLLAQQGARKMPETHTPQKTQPSQEWVVDPRVKARYVWDAERQQDIEKYLKAESTAMYGDVSQLKRRPLTTKPVLSLLPSSIGSNLSIRFERDAKSRADRAAAPDLSFYRRVGFREDAPLRKVPAAPSRADHPQPGRGGDNASSILDTSSPSLSSLAGSGTFWRAAPSGATQAHSAVAPSGGFAALEAAGVRDADIKAGGKNGSLGLETPQEWAQLVRKTTSKPNRGRGDWNAMQSDVAKSQPPISVDTSMSRSRPTTATLGDSGYDSRRVVNTNGAFDNTISRSPTSSSRSGDNDYDGGFDRGYNSRWKPSERERKPDKRRGGNRSQHASRFEDEDGDEAYDRYQEKRRQKEIRKAQREAEQTEPIPIILPELINITAFANALKIKPQDFLAQLGELGFEGVTLDSLMAGETAALVAQEYGYEPTVEAGDKQDLKPRPPPEDASLLPSRPPVVTIMGHVDHGKTTILDYLRQSSVAAQEHGGITQHIGAFSVKLSSGKQITFLDTPGHAAFLAMRQRGANVTDIVVLVVAADDSVKPQTLEALKHARAAKVPIIVAINKIDKGGARIDAVKSDLAGAGVEIEDFGGDVQVVCVSGKTGQGMDDLEENILTLSEILDHRSEVDGPAEGWVLESSLKPTGKVATVLVKRGTLRPGDYIAAGLTWAKIRQLRNEAGVDIAEAPPGTPVEILGWKDLPAAGDQVIQSPDEDRAKTAVSYREGLRDREKDATEYEAITEARKALQEKRTREKAAGDHGTGTQDILADEESSTKMVNFVVKGDVHGSVEAVCAAIQEIGSHEVRPRVLRWATGPISEYDVEHAATSNSVLVNFATATPGHVRHMAESQGVRILDHTVIYHLVDDVKAKLSEYLTPDVSTRVLGEAEVLQVFPINVRGRVFKNIAGCRVRNGIVGKNNLYRVIRKGETIFDGRLETLKHVKKDVMEMRKGTECGIGFEEFQNLEVGDQIQAYEEVRTTRKL